MITITLITFLVAMPLFSYVITPIIFNRITSIILIYSALLSLNVINISSLASGVGIYSGLFHVTPTSLSIEVFIFICATIILIAFKHTNINTSNDDNSSDDKKNPTRIADYAVIRDYSDDKKNPTGIADYAVIREYSDDKKNPTAIADYAVIREYSIIVVFTVIGQSILISSSDIVSIFLSIELQSFAVYVLCTLYRNQESATSAGLKYFLLGGLSSAVILLGTGVIYNYTGVTEFESIYLLCLNDEGPILTQVTLGLVLIGIGFIFKVASAPLHNWAPDVYDGVPTIVTTFISTIPKISLFVFLLSLEIFVGRYQAGSFEIIIDSNNINIFNEDINIWKNLLLIGSVLSLIIGTVLGLSQYRIKRLLAYSTISHVGFILLCLLINSEESIESFLFYIMQYSLTNICAFLCILIFSYTSSNNNDDIEFISEIKGVFFKNPVLTFTFSMCLFSIAGIPPLIGFFAKQTVLYSSTHAGYYFISIIAVVVSVISASYYLKIVKVLYFDNIENSEIVNDSKFNKYINASENNTNGISEVHSLCISVLLVIITLFILQPQILLNLSNLLSITLFYY